MSGKCRYSTLRQAVRKESRLVEDDAAELVVARRDSCEHQHTAWLRSRSFKGLPGDWSPDALDRQIASGGLGWSAPGIA